MNDRFTPPPHLSAEAKRLWAEVVPRRARSAGRLVMLQSALEALDRANQARTEVATAGLTTTTKTTGAVHIHPLLKVEREARAQFANIWSTLGFSFDRNEDGPTYEYWLKEQEKKK